jgi:putative transposase
LDPKALASDENSLKYSTRQHLLAHLSSADVDKLHSKNGQLVVERGFLVVAAQQLLGTRGKKVVSKDHKLSLRGQCALLTLSRSNLCYEPKGESDENLRFMKTLDKQFLETPWYGARQMARHIIRKD